MRECNACPKCVERCVHYNGTSVVLASWRAHREHGHNCRSIPGAEEFAVYVGSEGRSFPCRTCGLDKVYVSDSVLDVNPWLLTTNEVKALEQFELEVTALLDKMA